MFRSRLTMLLFAAAVAALTLCFGAATTNAQTTPADAFQVNYFTGANTTGTGTAAAPDATVYITNAGSQGGNDLCANIYVFNPEQELTECCSCEVTPDGLLALSVNQLTHNPLTGSATRQHAGVIKIVATTVTPANGCSNNQSSGAVTAGMTITPAGGGGSPLGAGLRAWATHVQRLSPANTSAGASAITEEEFEPAVLSSSEIATLTDKCGDIVDNGSGQGICACTQTLTGPGTAGLAAPTKK
jgi:hypothetical protein